MTAKLYAATKNKNKLKEIRFALPDVEVLEFPELPDIEETGTTFEENASIKAEFLSKLVGYPVIADDSGIEVSALNNAPGVYSARYAGAHGDDMANTVKLLKNMENAKDRSCKFVCVIALAENGKTKARFRGEVEGTLAYEPRGENGFGYDPVFILPYGRTMAELSLDEKSEISHRKKALIKLAAFTSGHNVRNA